MEDNTVGIREMPRYISCKPVWALKIASIDKTLTADVLHFEDAGSFAPRAMEPGWADKRGALPGGYFVQYEDGYPSFSPAAPFDKGNTLRDDWGVQRTQEPKYGVNLQGRIFNRHTGTPIPDEEPLFILRAKDRRALAALSVYLDSIPQSDAGTRLAVATVLERFLTFQKRFPEVLKDGDSKAPSPPVPTSIAQAPRTPERSRSPWPFPTRT